jgi:hypothetical protein
MIEAPDRLFFLFVSELGITGATLVFDIITGKKLHHSSLKLICYNSLRFYYSNRSLGRPTMIGLSENIGLTPLLLTGFYGPYGLDTLFFRLLQASHRFDYMIGCVYEIELNFIIRVGSRICCYLE